MFYVFLTFIILSSTFLHLCANIHPHTYQQCSRMCIIHIRLFHLVVDKYKCTIDQELPDVSADQSATVLSTNRFLYIDYYSTENTTFVHSTPVRLRQTSWVLCPSNNRLWHAFYVTVEPSCLSLDYCNALRMCHETTQLYRQTHDMYI